MFFFTIKCLIFNFETKKKKDLFVSLSRELFVCHVTATSGLRRGSVVKKKKNGGYYYVCVDF